MYDCVTNPKLGISFYSPNITLLVAYPFRGIPVQGATVNTSLSFQKFLLNIEACGIPWQIWKSSSRAKTSQAILLRTTAQDGTASPLDGSIWQERGYAPQGKSAAQESFQCLGVLCLHQQMHRNVVLILANTVASAAAPFCTLNDAKTTEQICVHLYIYVF